MIAYFKDGILNNDENLKEIINIFRIFIQKRTKKYRILKSSQETSSLFEKIIQLVGPALNVITFTIGFISKNAIFKSLQDIITNNYVLYGFIGLNIISVTAIFIYTLLPNIRLGLFKWSRGFKKL